jgi:hypothetical protein
MTELDFHGGQEALRVSAKRERPIRDHQRKRINADPASGERSSIVARCDRPFRRIEFFLLSSLSRLSYLCV